MTQTQILAYMTAYTGAILEQLEEGVVEKRLFDVKDLATYLGIAPQTIRHQVSAGTFPIKSIKIGRSRRWDRRDVDQWIVRKKKS